MNIELKYIDTGRQNYIKKFIRENILINLDFNEFNKLMDLLFNIIEYISNRFSFDPKLYNIYWNKLLQNNHQDLISILYLLLPYIDDTNSYELYKNIYKFNDISNKMKNNNFLISNIQYDLNINSNYYNFNIDNIIINYKLLLDTIDIVSNKLYINWIDIRPMSLTNYKNTLLYNNTMKFIKTDTNILIDELVLFINDNKMNISIFYNKLKLNIEYNNNIFNYKGLSFCDIFNTIYYDLFYDIYDIKWLIYNNIFDNINNNEIYIKKFNEYIAISSLYLNMKWIELSENEKFIFTNKIHNLYNLALSNKSYFNLLKYIIIFFERTYELINIIVNKYDYNKITSKTDKNIIDYDDYDNEDDEKDINNIDINELIINIKKIPVEYLYDYFLITIEKFKNTWYGKKIILNKDDKKDGVFIDNLKIFKFNYDSYISDDINKNLNSNIIQNILNDKINFINNNNNNNINELIINYMNNNPILLPETLHINYKFIYNYAKAFIMIYINNDNTVKTFERTKWNNMSFNNRINIIKLFNYTYIEGINKSDNPENNINLMSFKKYYNMIYNNNNVINKYINYLSTILYDYIQSNIIDIIFECLIYKGLLSEYIIDNKLDNIELYNKYSNDSYYFLTNDTYMNLNTNYFYDLIHNQKYYKFYSLNWIFQINFFHKYINNRILFVTGATGQGKSTQIPKLLLYSLKMIDKKYNGRIICSEPRILPTINNAKQIASQLGTPIYLNNTLFLSNNKYIQYNTRNYTYNVINNFDLLLKIVTDKLLLMELLNNPIFKRLIKLKEDTIGDDIEYNIYNKYNLYDIIIIDESHEHNLNMDLILTIVRDTIKYNNSLRLIIISATMQEDEKIYRYYYKEINDNFMYPFNFYNSENNLDRIFVDRRINISPPNKTTLYEITEKYLDNEPSNYDEAEELGYNKLIELINNKVKGNILFFSIGIEQIKKLVEKINNYIESHDNNNDYVCIPYFREIPNRWNIIDDLKKLNNFNIKRTNIYSNIFENKQYNKSIHYDYKYIIIISTNIAEASITIDNLKYIIDTGYHYSVSTDFYTNNVNIEIKKISETSRIQRKGRLGRISKGIIFYMYMKFSREKILTDYEICRKSIHFDLYDLCSKNNTQNYLIPDLNIYIKNINFIKKNYTDILFKYQYLKKSNIFDILIKEQYMYIDKWLPSSINLLSKNECKNLDLLINKLFYKWNCNFNKSIIINSITNRNKRYFTGYDIKTLFDIKGEFYIIHPDEYKIIRNKLNNNIIKVNNNYTNIIISDKIYTYIKKCLNLNLLINNNFNYHFNQKNLNITENVFNNINFNIEKSIFGRIIYSISKNINFLFIEDPEINFALLKTIIYSYIYEVEDIVILIISLLHISKYNIYFFDNIENNLSSNDGDLYVYYNIANNIYIKIKKLLKIYKIHISKKSNYNNYNTIIDINNFLEQKKILYNNPNNKININYELYNKFNALYNENKLNNKIYIDEITIKSIFTKKLTNILKIFFYNHDDYIIDNFINYYIDIKFKFDNIKEQNKFKWFYNNIPIINSNNIFNNVKYSFLYGFSSYNTVIFDDKINNYINPYNFNILNIKNTKTILTKYMVYIMNKKSSLFILLSIDKNDLIKINPNIYYPKNPLLLNKLFIDIYTSIQHNRFLYLKHLFLSKGIIKNEINLFSKHNNLIKNILILWNNNIN